MVLARLADAPNCGEFPARHLKIFYFFIPNTMTLLFDEQPRPDAAGELILISLREITQTGQLAINFR
jgi:hypothetical protein